MDSFGRLPSNILSNISNIFALPEIDIFHLGEQEFCLQIKYLHVTMKLNMVSELVSTNGKNVYRDDGRLGKFIDDLNNDIDCVYNNSYYDDYDGKKEIFRIEFWDEDRIIIETTDSEVYLSLESKDRLIFALNQYYEILKTHQ